MTAVAEPTTAAAPEAPAERRVVDPKVLRAQRTRPSRWRWILPTENRIWFLLAAVGYGFSGYVLSYRHQTNFGDAISRVSQTQAVLDSHDPHLAAIGFVYGPIPSGLLIPFFWIHHLWQPFLSRALMGNVESTLFMAGAVTLCNATLKRAGLAFPWRAFLTLGFAVHPIIAFYGGSGMSEPAELFFLVLACHQLVRYVVDGRGSTHRTMASLFGAGTATGLAYLVRIESAAAIAGVILFVGLVAYGRSAGAGFKERFRQVRVDVFLVGIPPVLLFGLWALISKIIVNQWIGYISSQYGASAELDAARQGIYDRGGHTAGARLHYVSSQIAHLEPAIVVAIVLAVLVATVLSSWLPLAASATLLPPLVLTTLTFTTGSTFGFLRFSITAVPFTVITLGLVVAALRMRNPDARLAPRIAGFLARSTAAVVAVALVAVAVPVSGYALFDRKLAPQESGPLRALFDRDNPTQSDRFELDDFGVERSIGQYIGGLDLPKGSVLTDTGSAFDIILNTPHPQIYVATTDRDFQKALANPALRGIQYLLVPQGGSGTYDALTAEFGPALYDYGAGIAELVKTFDGNGHTLSWRLYRLTAPASAF